MDSGKMNEIQNLKQGLKNKIFDQGFHWKILFIGTSVNGTTDIVSSLSRSLRNLGHHVLDLDTSRHRILNNPLRRQGGMGPIYVDYEKLSPTVEAFEPQVIICCAGGLTFTESDAQKLKDKGIVLVGITLSDPDVFPSIKEHQHVFDLHTTNAEISMAMYKEAGVYNTVYFPFGIDRGFVTQDVPASNEYDADVICLGHATNRPDRNSMMTYLDKKFDVRTYGRGWEVPNAITVAGQEMVQALQGGKIHVNFPLTRAGFINIKCGVFESAGQGKVVATGVFEEMSHFFKYDEEIIGYKDEADLEKKIARLLDNPAEYERIATAGFKRIVNEHLYEHRWMALFDELRSITIDNNRWLDRDRAIQIERILSSSYPRAKKVIISGFYGARNLGDEMILKSISSRIRQADPAAQVYVAAESPTNVESRHGLQAFDRKLHEVSAYQVKTAAAVVLGGGGLWHDYTFERGGGLAALFNGGKISMAGFGILPMMAKVVGAEFHVVGLGVGPLTDKYAVDTVRFLANQANSIYVRDPESESLLTEVVGLNSDQVFSAPDTVYGVEIPALKSHDERLKQLQRTGYSVLGLNLRPWAAENMVDIARTVSRAIISLEKKLRAEGKKLAVVSLPMQAGVRMDRAAVGEVFRRLPKSVETIELSADGEISLEQYLSALESCEAILAMRLHASLIAHRVGTPAVGLCYDPKVKRHFDEVDRSEFGLPLLANSEQILNALYTSMNDGISQKSKETIKSLEEAVGEALDVSVNAITSIVDEPRVYVVPADNEVTPKRRAVVPPAVKKASFQSIASQSVGIPGGLNAVRNDLKSGLEVLQLAMNVERPEAGMRVAHSGVLKFEEAKPTELSFKLTSLYNNAKAAGKLFVEFECGDQKFRQDLTETTMPVEIMLTASGKNELKFSFSIICEQDAFKARSWADATKVLLELVSTKHVARITETAMKAGAGTVITV
ncbi:polysaccharide pyruvyl transferase family protein [Glutamicibacter sp. 2E12]|uniref:polysaccharide pyruvyl transferase family protein n=1 Tax=Glutamicibacter sp. 2E12 TaxID=3416181 RepID=UPI003CF26AB4